MVEFIGEEDVAKFNIKRIRYDAERGVAWATLEDDTEKFSTMEVKIDDYLAKLKMCSHLRPFVTCECVDGDHMTTLKADRCIEELILPVFSNVKALAEGVKNVRD